MKVCEVKKNECYLRYTVHFAFKIDKGRRGLWKSFILVNLDDVFIDLKMREEVRVQGRGCGGEESVTTVCCRGDYQTEGPAAEPAGPEESQSHQPGQTGGTGQAVHQEGHSVQSPGSSCQHCSAQGETRGTGTDLKYWCPWSMAHGLLVHDLKP